MYVLCDGRSLHIDYGHFKLQIMGGVRLLAILQHVNKTLDDTLVLQIV